ncbi:hypothetical protein A2U01_0001892 [Trifolium medium]|uniref:Uncharacterized protein n=1 Tax=Trifolium medium TaxID=97028 RepID=A0A392M1A7_9FABA|nr:hypothetical protein [Trifolium medium]
MSDSDYDSDSDDDFREDEFSPEMVRVGEILHPVLKTLEKPTCEITARALDRFELARFIVPKRGQQPVAVTGRPVVEHFRVTAM